MCSTSQGHHKSRDGPRGRGNQMTIFKKRSKPTTHIVKRDVPKSPLHNAVTGGAQGVTRNWEIKRDEFRTFDSPPGRF